MERIAMCRAVDSESLCIFRDRYRPKALLCTIKTAISISAIRMAVIDWNVCLTFHVAIFSSKYNESAHL